MTTPTKSKKIAKSSTVTKTMPKKQSPRKSTQKSISIKSAPKKMLRIIRLKKNYIFNLKKNSSEYVELDIEDDNDIDDHIGDNDEYVSLEGDINIGYEELSDDDDDNEDENKDKYRDKDGNRDEDKDSDE
ncbi:hypothetical protein RhiirA5_508222 [Rhizophagus irregularis]|uniref:Uncharacterized protein n=1 Tax=Rhizophagus irregularis TaxID=588596 RepID=A0A2N0NDI4_9GLOM|nr:hypothetical protein RhiirA5_508222 [Rhizophagus irregularis]PKC74896.1 hypothetical protein RhiirA1_449448 [Rhizophagus irregularis]